MVFNKCIIIISRTPIWCICTLYHIRFEVTWADDSINLILWILTILQVVLVLAFVLDIGPIEGTTITKLWTLCLVCLAHEDSIWSCVWAAKTGPDASEHIITGSIDDSVKVWRWWGFKCFWVLISRALSDPTDSHIWDVRQRLHGCPSIYWH